MLQGGKEITNAGGIHQLWSISQPVCLGPCVWAHVPGPVLGIGDDIKGSRADITSQQLIAPKIG